MTLEERLHHRGWTVTEADCWEWNGTRDNYGYGVMTLDGKGRKVHRLAHEVWVGPIPDGMHVLHRCDNRSCINPEHLFLGTNLDNIADRVAKGRSAHNKGASKLTWEEVRSIRKERETEGTHLHKLGEKYGVAQATVWRIINNKAWKEVSA